MVHLRAIMAIAMPHAVERAGMQDAVVDRMALGQHGQRRKQVEIAGRHLVLVVVARHGVEAAMMDRPFRIVIFDVAHHVEGRALEENRPEGMGHGARPAAGHGDFGEDVRLLDAEQGFVRKHAMHLRRHAGVDRGIAGGGGRGQNRAHLPDAGFAGLHPAFQIAHQPSCVAPGLAVENDEQKFVAKRHLGVLGMM